LRCGSDACLSSFQTALSAAKGACLGDVLGDADPTGVLAVRPSWRFAIRKLISPSFPA